MSADGLPGEPPASDPVGGPALPVAGILATCDDLLGEVGRRSHLFSWLRDPAGEADGWLPVDAYYPAHRLLVVAASDCAELCAELAPAHGLRVLRLETERLPADPAALTAALRDLIAALGPLRAVPPPAPEVGRPPRERPVAQAVASLIKPAAAPRTPPRPTPGAQQAAARAVRLLAARRAVPRHTRPYGAPRPAPARAVRPRRDSRPRRPQTVAHAAPLQPPSLLMGVALAAVPAVEVYLAVSVVAVGAGQLLLALGIVLDACARTVGTLAAAKLGRSDWAWLCLLAGSPAVAGFALFQRSGPVTLEPAPLAGLLSLAALGIVAVALVALLLGI